MGDAMISADRVRQLLSYDPETGVFMWRERGMRRQLNRPITCKRRGYVHVTIAYKNYPAHQLAWLYVHNEWPSKEIDHINGIRDDNRIANLRLATRTENQRNIAPLSNNKSGYKGVCWHAASGKWRAIIGVAHKQIHLGVFADKEAALKARRDAANEYFGEFARESRGESER
jgi:hypothetical protein